MNHIILDISQFISNLMIILGLPVAVFQYTKTTQKERADREYTVYDSLDEKFLDWEKLCLTYPGLDIFDVQDPTPAVLNSTQKKEELVLFTILFSILERAYILYSNQSTAIKKAQWNGWDSYILNYCSRDNFIQAWKVSGATFDERFQTYMDKNIIDLAK